MSLFGGRIATIDIWAKNWLCTESTTEEDQKNWSPVGLSPSGSRGEKFLEI